MAHFQVDDSESTEDTDLNIVITQSEYPRYLASGQLYHRSIEKTKHFIYRNKYRAHRDQSIYPDHVTAITKPTYGDRPWYSMHQCLDGDCQVHPGNRELIDVTEVKKMAEPDDGKSGFLCSYLSGNFNLDMYPFYKRSIECYTKSFGKTNSAIVKEKERFDAGVWHDPSCEFCDSKWMHLADFRPLVRYMERDDVTGIFYKYRFIFDPEYILGKELADRMCFESKHIGNTPKRDEAQCQSGNDGKRVQQMKTIKDSYAQRQGNRYTPKQHNGHGSPFCKHQTPNKSTFTNRYGTNTSLNSQSPNFHQGRAPYYRRSAYNNWTPPNRASPYSPTCLPRWQTPTPTYHQYSSVSPYQTPPIVNTPPQSGYYGNYRGPHTPAYDARLNPAGRSPAATSPASWSGDTRYHTQHYQWQVSPWHQYYNQAQYAQTYTLGTYQPQATDPYNQDSVGHTLYGRSKEIDNEGEDPLMSTWRQTDSMAHSTRYYTENHERNDDSRRGRYDSGSYRENYRQRKREKRERSPSESRRCSISRTAEIKCHSSRSSSRCHQSHTNSKTRSSKRDRSPKKSSHRSKEGRRVSREQKTSCSRPRLSKRSSSRKRSPEIRSTVKLVRKGHTK